MFNYFVLKIPAKTAENTPKKVFIKTFGCQMNEYDSSRMADMLNADSGMVETQTVEDADVILLNTCACAKKPKTKCLAIWVDLFH